MTVREVPIFKCTQPTLHLIALQLFHYCPIQILTRQIGMRKHSTTIITTHTHAHTSARTHTHTQVLSWALALN